MAGVSPGPREIVVAGASVAGVGVADELRRLGYDGRLILLNAEPHVPYDRPPLSKGLLTGETSADRAALRKPGHYADRDIDLRTGVAATRLSPGPELELSTSDVLHPDAVVIATGARARRLPAAAPEPGRRGAAAEPGRRGAAAEPDGRDAASGPDGRDAASRRGAASGPDGRGAAAEPDGRDATSRLDAHGALAGAVPDARGGPVDGVPTVRDLDDALWLRDRLSSGMRLVVIGGGFIGGEVAASARKLGADVTMVEAAPIPLAGVLGAEPARALLRPHRDAGVRVRCGVPVTRVDRSGRVTLADGDVITADLVVAGLGSVPNTEWLAGSGLDLADGVRCDATGATALPGVYAAGDVAAWRDASAGRHVRHEHWTRAREQAKAVAARILGVEPPTLGPPYFWSDQYGRRIQALGDTANADTISLVHGAFGTGSWVALYARAGRLTGAAGYNAAAVLMRHRTAIATGEPFPGACTPPVS